jgi:hypothetical protein
MDFEQWWAANKAQRRFSGDGNAKVWAEHAWIAGRAELAAFYFAATSKRAISPGDIIRDLGRGRNPGDGQR